VRDVRGTGRTSTNRKTRWTAVCRLTTRRYIGHQCRGQATLPTAASSTTSDDLTSSSRQPAACCLTPATSQTPRLNTPRPPPRHRGLVGAVSASAVSRRRRVQLVIVEYRSGQRETWPVQSTRAPLITTRLVLADTASYTTAPYL